jgi:hypothetical protein
MYNLLLKYWKSKIKLTDDTKLFQLFLYVYVLIVLASTILLEYICIQQTDAISLIIVLTLIMQYNWDAIISAITDIRKSSFLVTGSRTGIRFVYFQIMKENFMLIPVAVISVFMVFVALVFHPIMALEMTLILAVEIGMYFFSIYVVIYKRRHKKSKYKNLNILTKHKYIQSVISYFVRLPMEEYAEMIIQLVALLFCVYKGLSVIVVNYFLIAFMVMDIEMLQDKSMNQYDITYGKYAFREMTHISKIKKFLISDEGKVFFKNMIFEVCLVAYGNITLVAFILLLYTISYRYFCCMQIVLKRRVLLRNTRFRMAMLYYILLSIAPFLFEKEMHKIFNGYQIEYGVLYFVILSIIMLCIPFEKIVNVMGKSIDEA